MGASMPSIAKVPFYLGNLVRHWGTLAFDTCMSGTTFISCGKWECEHLWKKCIICPLDTGNVIHTLKRTASPQ